MRRVEEKARALLDQAGERTAPIDPERVAKWLGIKVDRIPFEGDLSGILVRNATQVVIGVNKFNAPVRQRFTIAHELGHYALEHRGEMFVDEAVLNKRDGRSSIAIDPQEIEANNFAAALLMPKHLVVSELKERLPSLGDAGRDSLIRAMAAHFKVSEQAMGFRLVNLGLISANW